MQQLGDGTCIDLNSVPPAWDEPSGVWNSSWLRISRTNGKWTLAVALFDSKGRVRNDHVLLKGKDENRLDRITQTTRLSLYGY